MLQTFMFLGHWKNYSDRIIKKNPANSGEMWEMIDGWPYAKYVPDTNFDIGDGVDTSVVVEWTDQWFPNYVWVTGNIDGGKNEIQGWYVIEFKQLRGQQFRAVLHRDVIADNYDKVLESTCFIEKGQLQPTNPLIFNREDMEFNQIKQEEILLKDQTEVSWIVGYLASNTNTPDSLKYTGTSAGRPYTGAKIVAEANEYDYADIAINADSLSFADIINYNVAQDKKFKNLTNLQVGVSCRRGDTIAYYLSSYILDFSRNVKPEKTAFINAYTNFSDHYLTDSYEFRYHQDITLNAFRPISATPIKQFLLSRGRDIMYETLDDTTYNSLRYTLRTFVTGMTSYRDDLELILSYNNRIIVHNNHYYKLKISKTIGESGREVARGNAWVTNTIKPYLTTALTEVSNKLAQEVKGLTYSKVEEIADYSYLIGMEYQEYRIDAIPVVSTTVNTVIINSTPEEGDAVNQIYRNTLADAPYDMFAIPYIDENGEGFDCNITGTGTFKMSGDISLRIAQAIAVAFGDACYDLQVVPYCPLPELEAGTPIYSVYRAHKDYSLVREGSDPAAGDILGVVFYAHTSKGTLDIVHSIPGGTSAVEKKMINECETYKICSPNFSGEFEFSPAKNNGVDFFNVDYLYKPFSPYIHVNPNFKGLYGQDYNDARGLICGGSFSAGSVKSAWTNYELNNKNYAEIFGRQIQSLDTMNSIALSKQKISTAVGTVQGGMGGAITGGMFGGPYGAIAGGVLGTIGSLGAGIADTEFLKQEQAEQRAYQIDMYNYNLGNIKAMPYSLSQVSALTNNNKLFPFVEKYSCTDEEKEIFENKLKYDGMTVMKIDQIKNYILGDENFVRAALIRTAGISDDNHTIETIDSELRKGVYL